MSPKRWIAELTTYEPPFKSSKWGSSCIETRFSDEKLSKNIIEISKCGNGLNLEATERREKSGETFTFFPSDIDYRDLRQLF